MHSRVHRGQEIEFFSTHPNPENRIEKIEQWLPEALLKYEASDCKRYLSEFADAFRKQWARW